MNCDDIRRKLQPFLEDLLVEEEYKTFCGHLDVCARCCAYVRSIGALSNQLWKLGKVKVPGDLGSTIIYKLSHHGAEERPSKFSVSKNHIVAGAILIFLAAALFLGIGHIRKERGGGKDGAPTVSTKVIYEDQPSSDEQAQLLDQLKIIAADSGASDNYKIIQEAGKEKIAAQNSAVQREQPGPGQAAFSEIGYLHWHFLCLERHEKAMPGKETESLDLKIRKGSEMVSLLNTELERLREEARLMSVGRYYPGVGQKGASGQNPRMETEIKDLLNEIKKQEENVRRTKGEKNRLEVNLRLGIDEKYRKETELIAKVSDAVRAAGVSLYYQKNDMLVFRATGERIEKLLAQILSLSRGAAFFRDFTAVVPTLRGKEYNVSIYIGHGDSASPHWHIDPVTQSKKSDILDIVKGSSSSTDYSSDGLIILSIPSVEIGKLRARIMAARVPMSEYGSMESKEDTLSSGPVALSIYFTK
jgi:hypothetical protein